MSIFMAGAGKAVIHPFALGYPVPRVDGATYDTEYDEISCRALALTCETYRQLIVSFELISPPNVPELKKRIAETTRFQEDEILLTATHNHTAPYDTAFWKPMPEPWEEHFYEAFRKEEASAALQACQKAVETLRPVRYGYSEGESFINVNRNYRDLIGRLKEANYPAGHSDKTLSILRLEDMDGKIVAVLVNHSTHATCAFLSRDFDHKNKTSGNFSGIACRFVEEYYGGGAAVLWTSGAAGDQNPVMGHGLLLQNPDGSVSQPQIPDGMEYLQMEYIGRMHGTDIVRQIDRTKCSDDQIKICRLKREVIFPGKRGCQPDPEKPVWMQMEVLKLGDVAIIAAGAELYSEIGMEMKKVSPCSQTVVVTDIDCRQLCYIPDREYQEEYLFQDVSPVYPKDAAETILTVEQEMFTDLENQFCQGLVGGRNV